MMVDIRPYTVDRLDDVIDFEQKLREEEDVWGWDIDEAYRSGVRNSFADPTFDDCISLLAYADGMVVGRIDACMLKSRFDGTTRAYLDWICVLKSRRHQGVAQTLWSALIRYLHQRGITCMVALTAANEEAQRFYRSVPNASMHDVGIWVDID